MSTQHASLRWSGAGWQVRDLGSRNGTMVRGRPVDAGRWVTLTRGDTLAFGGGDEWEMLDDTAPAALASCDGEVVEAEGGLLTLAGSHGVGVLIYTRADGAWIADLGDTTVELQDGATLETGGRTWTLALPTILPATRPGRATTELAGCHLVFCVSQDEEHIEIEVQNGASTERMPYRAHNELLLVLARARLEDAEAGLPDPEQGWRYPADVAQRLSLPILHFNMVLHRARAQYRQAGYADADDIVQRRRGSGQVRLGFGALSVRPFA